MNILVIPCWFPNGTDKLIGVYHKEFCEALGARENINVNMLYIDRQGLKNAPKYLFMKKKEVIKEHNYDVYMTKMIDIQKISFDAQMKRYSKVLEKAFKEYLKDNPKPDVIHAQVTIPSGYAACLIGKKYNIPVVVTEHATYYKRFFEDASKKYGDYVLENAYFTTVSSFMAKEIAKHKVKCSVLPNLVDTEIFKKEHKIPEGLRIVTASALRQGKRIDDTIMALKKIKEIEPDIDAKLTIIGDGFLEDYYKNKCHELEMDKDVDFVGRKTKKEIADIFQNQTLLVLASDNETFAIPGVEALASGMPVVSTKCFGPEEYIDNKCGKLVDIGDTDSLAKAILDVYHNIDKYDIKYLREVADRYSAKSVTDKAIKIYQDLTK